MYRCEHGADRDECVSCAKIEEFEWQKQQRIQAAERKFMTDGAELMQEAAKFLRDPMGRFMVGEKIADALDAAVRELKAARGE